MRTAVGLCLAVSLSVCALPASATAIDTSGLPEAVVLNTDPSSSEAQVYQDGTKLIANDIVCGEEVFQITARFLAVDPPEEIPLFTTICVGFAYQNGDGTFGSNPHFSFYQFRMELKGEENNAFVQLQKQVDDTDYSRIKPVTVDGEGQGAAEDGFYVTADNGWDTNAEEGFVLTATVDLPNNLAVCEIEGLTTGTKGTMTVDLTTKAVGEQDALHTLGAGGIFVDFDPNWVDLEEWKVAGEEIPEADPGPVALNWLSAQQAYIAQPYGGVACPRMLTLQNGTILCAFDANDTQGGNSVIKVIQSTNGGNSWQGTNQATENAVMQRNDQMIYANPSLFQLDNGDVLVAYRGLSAGSGVKNSGLFVSVSHDNGVTWSTHSTILSYNQHDGGVYEPCLVEINGTPTVFYANDSVAAAGETVGTGVVGGNHQPAVTSLAYQNIEYMQWDGSQWGNRTIACNGANSGSRDGMPGVTQLQDGSWMLAYEANNTSGTYPFILRYKISEDGLNWDTAPGTGNGTAFCIADTEGRKTSGPALATLPDGRVVCVFQTDQDASQAGDSNSTLRLMISESADPADGWGEWMDVFSTPDGNSSVWNGVALSGNQLFVLTSTNYPSNSIYIRRAVWE